MATPKFDDNFRYKAIKMFCEGKSASFVGRNIGTSADTVLKWVRQFVSYKILNNTEFVEDKKEELEKFRKQAELKITTIVYDDAFRFTVIEEYCNGKSKKDVAKHFDITVKTLNAWIDKLLKDGCLYEEEFNLENKKKLSLLQSSLTEKISKSAGYNSAFKYQIIKQFLDGTSYKEIKEKYSLPSNTVREWIHRFAEKGPFEDSDISLYTQEEFEELQRRAIKKSKELRKEPDYELVYKIISFICDNHSFSEAGRKFGVSNSTATRYLRLFIDDVEFRRKIVSKTNVNNLEPLFELAIKRNSEMSFNKDDKTKYQAIALYCKGTPLYSLEIQFKVTDNTIQRWVHDFAENGPFNPDEISDNEKVELELLQEAAKEKLLSIKKHKTSTDTDFSWLLEYDEDLKEWAIYAEEWIKEQVSNKAACLNALSIFFKRYIIPHNISRNLREFLSVNYIAPDFYEILFSEHKDRGQALNSARKIISFIDWILIKDYSIEDDFGVKCIPYEFKNSLSKYLPNYEKVVRRNESDKNVLPYRYIKQLKAIICPEGSTCFKDWTFAQNAMLSSSTGGDWFKVDKSVIDESDPDCVYRCRPATKTELSRNSKEETVYELWFPGRAVGILVKLMLPLRTFQVRMLDSGECDTFKYMQLEPDKIGEWVLNDCPLARGTPERPIENGVFRKFIDPVTHIAMTGFYINTNKTADIDKPEDQKGYNIPWQYEEMHFWLVKFRNWQQKYNPIDKPTPWFQLTKKELGRTIDERVLKQKGSVSFLFRSPLNSNNGLPIGPHILESLWYKLLQQLESDIRKNATTEVEKELRFVEENSKTKTFYPLHSLRVSLITAYALDGGVPMPILSKCIAGHARLVMTLYYTKMGISYVTDAMTKAEKNILTKEQESFDRFIRDAKYSELESNVAVNDTIAYQAALNAQTSGAALIINDKGMCPKSCFGCNSGGVYINEDAETISYGPVEGYPERNCVRCRWFLTGPAFLPGLTHHFNVLSYNISETAKRLNKYQDKIEILENRKYDCEMNNQVFDEYEALSKYEYVYQQELQKNDKFANDLNATLRLIDKCRAIAYNKSSESTLQLVPAGSIDDVRFAIDDAEHEIEQLQAICNGAELYPETDASKAVLQRAQILDLTFLNNGYSPIMLKLSEEDQLLAGNQFMRLIMKRAGSLKEAIPYAIGRKRLEEIGLTNEFVTSELKAFTLEDTELYFPINTSENTED